MSKQDSVTSSALFARAFKGLEGFAPFAWQCRLFDRIAEGRIPRTCSVPTGLGKTAAIHAWLIALAENPTVVPRRLIYIVNRRTVVDQATAIAERLREKLQNPKDEAVRDLATKLRALDSFGSEHLLAVSTLRGELADNEEWKTDPARPALIIGTVDMIGSKLLFSGYGDRRYGRAQHAGLVGQDALIIHDEAHLTPAFSNLLRAVADEQEREQKSEGRRIRVLELSATTRGDDPEPITLLPEDEAGETEQARTTRLRLDGEKHLHWHPCAASDVKERLGELAASHAEARAKVLLYVTGVEDAKAVSEALRRRFPASEAGGRVELLTGTLRGWERDELMRTRVLASFLNPGEAAPETLFLVSTSAGEVGIDMDADHMVCDLSTLDSLIQRLGRVNRRGGRTARVDVAAASGGEGERAAAVQATRAALGQLPQRADGSSDASVRAVAALLAGMSDEQKREAFQQPPRVVAVTDILFDAWSLSSIDGKLPGRPEVAAFLHGLTNAPPETHVAWREEIRLFAKSGTGAATLRQWFRACRLKAHEQLRDTTGRVVQHLFKIRDRAPDTLAIILDERGNAERLTLAELPPKKEDAAALLAFKTIVLPVEAGGLKHGMLDGSQREKTRDVAERAQPGAEQPRRARLSLHVVDGEFEAQPLDAAGAFAAAENSLVGECRSERQAARNLAGRDWKVALLLPLAEALDGSEDETSEYLVLLAERAAVDLDDPENAAQLRQQSIAEHTDDVVGRMEKILAALPLPKPVKDALLLAAKLHDSGKDRRIWQRAIHNDDLDNPRAKSGVAGMDGRRLGGYRHEFGSLLDAAGSELLAGVADEVRDLALHLIATHHGHGRPHFEPETYNFERHNSRQNETVVRDCIERFARLQLRYGRWHLAWIESLLRCADGMASAEPTPAPAS